MLIEDGRVMFGEWLPDQPDFENPGLVEARNCLPIDNAYGPFGSVAVSDDALAAAPIGAYATIDDAGDPEIYAGTTTTLYEKTGSSWTSRTAAPYTSGATDYWRFSQFDSYVIATNMADVPQRKVIGAAANFAALASTGAAPRARQVGVIGRFAVLGDINDGVTALPFAVQWSGIDDITNWPTPNTSAARAVQSGRQILNSAYGAVTAIAQGEFFGLIFQKRGITRATYIGGDKVFQFETFEKNRGCWAPQSMIQLGGLCYFLAHDGWCVTDGQTVQPIGDGKVDRWFFSRVVQSRLKEVTVGVDWTNKCILWNFPTSSAASGVTNYIIVHNFRTKRFAYAEVGVQLLIQSFSEGFTLEELDTFSSSIDALAESLDSPVWQGGAPSLGLFSTNKLGGFTGAALDALFETGESAPNAFGYTFFRGIRPLVSGTPTALTVQLGTRENQDDARTYSDEISRTTRTGVCDFRDNAKFASARMNVRGGFNRASGLGIDFELSDAA